MKLSIVVVAFVAASLSLLEGSDGMHQTEHRHSRFVNQRTDENLRPNLLQKFIAVSQDIQNASSKGLEYYLANYGPLVRIIVNDLMGSFGFARNLRLAIPIVAKMLVIGAYAFMQFQPSLRAFQQTARSAYYFLRDFNEPEVRVMNDITDRVFEVLDGEAVVM